MRPPLASFTLDATEAEEREKEMGRLEETILEGAGRTADALAGSSSDSLAPETQDDSRYVNCELLTQQEALQAKIQEMDAALAQLQVSPLAHTLDIDLGDQFGRLANLGWNTVVIWLGSRSIAHYGRLLV